MRFSVLFTFLGRVLLLIGSLGHRGLSEAKKKKSVMTLLLNMVVQDNEMWSNWNVIHS